MIESKVSPALFVLEDGQGDLKPVFCCPVCGDRNVHLGPVSVFQGHTTTTVSNSGTVVSKSPRHERFRGSMVTMSFHCEGGHEFEYEFEFHKGTTTCCVLSGAYDMEAGEIPELWRD